MLLLNRSVVAALLSPDDYLTAVEDAFRAHGQGANVLFYPSLIIFAAGLVLWAFQDEDRLVVGPRTTVR